MKHEMTQFFKQTFVLLLLSGVANGLWGQSKDQNQADVQVLLQNAVTLLKDGETDDAIGIAAFGLNLAIDLENTLLVLDFKSVLGEAYLLKKEYRKSVKLYLEIISASDGENGNERHAMAQYALAEVYTIMGAHTKAIDYYKRALNVHDRGQRQSAMVEVLESLGNSYLKLNDEEKALEVFKVMNDIGTELNEVRVRIRSLRLQSKIQEETGDINEARQSYVELLTLLESPADRAEIYYELSVASYATQDTGDALTYARRSVDLFPTNTKYINQYGLSLMQNGDMNGAFQELNKSLNYAISKDDHLAAAQCYNHLGLIQFRRNDLRTALTYYSRAESLGLEHRITKTLGRTYQLMVELYERRNNDALALEYIQKGRHLDIENAQNEVDSSASELKNAAEIAEQMEQELLVIIADEERKQLELSQSRLVQETESQRIALLEQQKALQDQELERQKLEAVRTQQDLLITKQRLDNEQRRAALERLEQETRLREISEEENQKKLELAERDRQLLDQRNKLQAAEIKTAEQARSYLIVIVAAALLALGLLLILVIRVNKTKRVITKQKENLELQRNELTTAQTKLKETLKDQVKAKNNLERVHMDLKNAQTQLIHAEKMSSLGQLTAGIAHEVNNPVGFVKGGIQSLKMVAEELVDLVRTVESLNPEDEDFLKRYRTTQIEIAEEVPELESTLHQFIKDILFGATRIEEIVDGLRTFSRHDEADIKLSNLHENLDSSLLILRNKFKQKDIKLTKSYDSNIKDIECYPGQLNQVFVNILGNAADAVAQSGRIMISTKEVDNHVYVSIRDDGNGIPEHIKKRIFEPFFTTKEVGEGTGLGLSISYSIIKDHGGTIKVKSELNKGTLFVIVLNKYLIKSRKTDQELLEIE